MNDGRFGERKPKLWRCSLLCRLKQRISGSESTDGPLLSRLASTQSIAGGEELLFLSAPPADSRDEKNRRGTLQRGRCGAARARYRGSARPGASLKFQIRPAISTRAPRDIVMRASDLCKSRLSNRGGKATRHRANISGDL